MTPREVAEKCAEICDEMAEDLRPDCERDYTNNDGTATSLAESIRSFAATLPDWVSVPREPTVEMVERGWNESRHELAGAPSARACYRAMLSAAPCKGEAG